MSNDSTGSDDEFDSFYRENYNEVCRFARTLVSDGDVDDIVSTTFTTAWRKFDQVPSDSPRGWLFGTARNMARNHWAMGRRGKSLVEAITLARPKVTTRLASAGFDPVEIEPFLELLRDLDERDKELMIMAGWFEMTPKEIGTATGERAGNVRIRLYRLRKDLETDFNARLDGGAVA